MRIVIFLVGLGVSWLPIALPIYAWGNPIDPNLTSIIALCLLYGEFLVWAWIWRSRLEHDLYPFQSYGLYWRWPMLTEFFRGLGIGLGGILALFSLEVLGQWIEIREAILPPFTLVITAFTVAIGVSFAEELLFRGWLLSELERDYSLPLAMGIQSSIFAIAHFIRPIDEIIASSPQFIGLVCLGITLALAKHTAISPAREAHHPPDPSRPTAAPIEHSEHLDFPHGQLGLPIGLHAGLVAGYYIVNVGELVTYTGRAPDWVVGINQNPLAGMLGIILLIAIALGLRYIYPRHCP